MESVTSPVSDSPKEIGEEEMQTEDQEETNSPKDAQMKRKRSPNSLETENGSNLSDHRALKKEKKEENGSFGVHDENSPELKEEEEELTTDASKEESKEELFVDSTTLSPFAGTELPYSLNLLTWDRNHRTNTQHIYCYCGKPRTRWNVMLKCASCRQWFHIECLKKKPQPTSLLGDWSYTFKCTICNKSDTEYFQPIGKSWTDIVRVALYNLTMREKQKNSSKRYFQYKDEICSYIDKHWDSLCHEKTSIVCTKNNQLGTKTWENTIGSALSTKSNYFKSGADSVGSAGYWGLRHEEDPVLVKESAIKAAPKNVNKEKKKKGLSSPSSSKSGKRKEEKLKRKFKPVPEILFYPRQYFDSKFYKYTEVCLAKENSAPQVKISSDKLSASNEKGHRMVRASFGVREGSWYYEIEILPHQGNTRLGWSTEKGDMQAPVGYDKYSYSYRDKEGTKFHQSRGAPYGAPYGTPHGSLTFQGPGDVIGFLIRLPPKKEPEKKPEVPEAEATTAAAPPKKKEEEEPARLDNSEIRFFKNGVDQGVAFSNLYEGTYFPAGSLYGGGAVKFNFGPTFKFPPKEIEFTPCTELPKTILVEEKPDETVHQNGITEGQNAIPDPSSTTISVTPTITIPPQREDTVKSVGIPN